MSALLRWAASPRGVDLQAEAAAGAPEAFRLTLGPATGAAVWFVGMPTGASATPRC